MPLGSGFGGLFLSGLAALAIGAGAAAQDLLDRHEPKPGSGARNAESTDEKPPYYDFHARPHRTLRSGEGFRTEVFGEEVVVSARDRRAVSAWDLGLAAVTPRAEESEILPFASLYSRRRRSGSGIAWWRRSTRGPDRGSTASRRRGSAAARCRWGRSSNRLQGRFCPAR